MFICWFFVLNYSSRINVVHSITQKKPKWHTVSLKRRLLNHSSWWKYVMLLVFFTCVTQCKMLCTITFMKIKYLYRYDTIHWPIYNAFKTNDFSTESIHFLRSNIYWTQSMKILALKGLISNEDDERKIMKLYITVLMLTLIIPLLKNCQSSTKWRLISPSISLLLFTATLPRYDRHLLIAIL